MSKSYTAKAENAMEIAVRSAKLLHHNYVGTEHLLLGLLKEGTGSAACVLMSCGVTEDKLSELIKDLIAPSSDVLVREKPGFSPKALRIISQAEVEAERSDMSQIGTEHLLLAILKEPDCAAMRLLTTMNINIQRVVAEVLIAAGLDPNMYREEMQNQGKSNKSTATLDEYSRDLTELAMDGKLDPVVGRDKEIDRLIQILSRRTKNNPCLIGEPGVGKSAIVEGLAQKIVDGEVPDTVADKRLLSLDISGMVAGTKYRGEFEERIKNVIREVRDNSNVILFMDELHTLIGAGGAEGALDAANILKPALARGEIQLIGATTIDEYRKHIEKDAALERRFQSVMVEEPTVDETIEILKGIRHKYEEHHNVAISDEAVEACASLSNRYINDRFLPDKAIDLMDEAASRAKLHVNKEPGEISEINDKIYELESEFIDALSAGDKEKAASVMAEKKALEKNKEKLEKRHNKKKTAKKITIGESDIADIVSDWTKIPVKKLTEGEAERLRKLEKLLHKRVIGQEDAISSVSKAVRRGRVGLKDPNRPIGSFLFLGPTGVGKTEVSKALAEAIFGDEQAMIRVDMSEYMEKHSVSKMVGSPPGYVGFEDGGQLSEQVRRHPYSVLLFDEIEKAHPDVFNILLQVLDEGRITDSKGRKIDFKNTIIIMTSNAGARSIVAPKTLGFATEQNEKHDYEKMKSLVMEDVSHIFKPEFLNRIDDILVFRMLNKEDMKQIVTLQAKTLIKRCAEQMDITLNISSPAKAYIVEKAYDPKYGARPIKRMIQNKIEDALAEEILSGRVKRGNTVNVTLKKGEISFDVV
ncbi:MAG: ATP-dependent Clp protease ATP-binding subunit [Lachnospiraceae bacterium]|nr:ATP-dependent Clp protease ATP-binding subunit [Lachnospiraceae bacterium]